MKYKQLKYEQAVVNEYELLLQRLFFNSRLGKLWHKDTCEVRVDDIPSRCECGFSQAENMLSTARSMEHQRKEAKRKIRSLNQLAAGKWKRT